MEMVAAISAKLYSPVASLVRLPGLTFLKIERLLARILGIGSQDGSP